MLLSFFVFGLLIVSSVFLGKMACDDKRYVFIGVGLSIFIFVLISGLRYDVGTDYFSYLSEYNRVLVGLDFSRDFEIGFEALTRGLSAWGLSPFFYFALWSFLQISLLYYALRGYKFLYPFLILILVLSGGYHMWMNGIRQSIALMFYLLSLVYVSEKRFYKFVFSIFLGYLFHKSLIVFLPFYFFLKNGIDYFPNVKVQFVLIVISFFVGTTLFSLLSPYVNPFLNFIGYSSLDYEARLAGQMVDGVRGWGPRRIIAFCMNLMVVLFSKQTKKSYNDKFYFILYNIFFIGLLLELLFFRSSEMMRLFYYFTGFNFILQAFLLAYLFREKRTLAWGYICMFVVLFVGHSYAALTDGDAHFLYQFCCI